LLKGPGVFFDELTGVYLDTLSRPVMGYYLSSLLEVEHGGQIILTLAISDEPTINKPAEGYILQISNGTVTVKSRWEAKIFYEWKHWNNY